jgi:hypothetical protein
MKTIKGMWIVLGLILILIFAIGCTTRSNEITGDAVLDYESEDEEEDTTTETTTEVKTTETKTESKQEVTLLPLQASKIATEYEIANFKEDCGSYVTRNNDAGNRGNYATVYKCFRIAAKACESAKAFIDVQTQEGARIVSFLSTNNCKITNHIKGNDPYGYSGEDMKTCNEINVNLALQYTCIGYV